MIEQLKTIREALQQAKDNTTHGQIAWNCKQALAALTQLEAMVGEHEPVAWVQQTDAELTPADAFSWVQTAVHNLPLYAAPVAQQPQADSIPVAAFDRLMALCESQAQRIIELEDKQPQAEAVPLNADGHPDAAASIAVMDKMATAAGIPPYSHIQRLLAGKSTPQQAEAVPPGYAGVTVWIGGKQVTRIATETEIRHEREPGLVLKQAALMAAAIAAAQGAKT